jgi:hypothetical protein
MVCRRAINIGCPAPAADYLVWPVANDNRRRWALPEWMQSAFGIGACCVAQTVWSVFLVLQLQG